MFICLVLGFICLFFIVALAALKPAMQHRNDLEFPPPHPVHCECRDCRQVLPFPVGIHSTEDLTQSLIHLGKQSTKRSIASVLVFEIISEFYSLCLFLNV